MKEMLAKAKAEKEVKKLSENLQGIYKKDDEIDLANDKSFFEELKEKADIRFQEK
jgi:S-adenosylmethionine synthetase